MEATQATSSKSANPTVIHLTNKCFLCADGDQSFGTPCNLRRHLVSEHDFNVPSRRPGQKMRSTPLVTYVMGAQDITPSHPGLTEHAVCPSCCFSCEKLSDLKDHVVSEHRPKEEKKHDMDEVSEERSTKRAKSVSIVGEKQIFTFSAAQSLPPPNCPGIPSDVPEKLQDIMTVLVPANHHLTDDQKALVTRETEDQQTLKSLKGFRAAFKFLCEALDRPYKDMPVFLWTCGPSSEDLSPEEQQLIRIIQLVLTDFSGKCSRNPAFQPKSERTFWVDRVVPILQSLADQTGRLGFEWCDKMESSTSTETWKANNSVQFIDGRGYDSDGRNWMALEASSGQYAEKVEHTINDTIKDTQTAIAILKAVVRRNQYSRFTTMTQFLAFTVQSVCRTLTLTTTQLDPQNPGRYIVQQRREAEVPITYEQRHDWLKMFEMVAFLLVAIPKQSEVLDNLAREGSGLLDTPQDDYIRTVLELGKIGD
ncbi:hypothetical protein B0O80DRAFT_450269 [Mortierella sp. GBAus27b]|nr:hypothetical protein B0O80DRAFT_450269 [Mortierella sp. GBAus27b]